MTSLSLRKKVAWENNSLPSPHEAFPRTGQTVAVRDYDAQGSASKALTRIQGIKEVPGQTYQVLLIDTPPSLTLATAAAVASVDIILIPTSPSPVDVWEEMRQPASPKAKVPKQSSELY